MPVLIGRPRTLEEFAVFVTEMAQLNPNGFRTPGKHSLAYGGSLPERASIRAGLTEIELPVGSKRGQKKRKIRQETRRLIREGKTWIE